MSGATSEVLQEYLLKLGFQTDQISLRKFEDSLGKTGKSVFKLGAGVAGVVASVEAAAAAFAYSMRKSFYQAELSNSTVKSIQSATYAGKQFGISADSMAGSIKGMAQAMRMNPGLKGLVESFGIKVTGRDTSDVMMDYVKALKDMPEFVGAQYAGMFGMDQDTFHQVRAHYDEIIAKRAELTRMQQAAGIDIDAQKEKMLAYTASMDKLSARFEIFSQTFLSSMGPVFEWSTRMLDHIIEGWTFIFASAEQKKAMLRPENKGGATGDWGAGSGVSGGATGDWGDTEHDVNARIIRGEQIGPATMPKGTGNRNERNNNPGNIRFGEFAKSQGAVGQDDKGFAIFPDMAAGFAATQALLGNYGKKGINTVASVIGRWAPPSENNTNAYAGYVAKQMGVGLNDKLDMNDPRIRAGLSKHIAKYEGLSSAALAGADNTRLGGGNAGAVALNNNVTINVTGTGADATAKAVSREQSRVLGDGVRMLKGSVG